MGLSMDDLHTPTVPSWPSSNGVRNGLPKEELTLQELIAEKDRVEGEITALCAVLESHKVDMGTPLTIDGFPRSDIDVAQIRTTRTRIIHLRNDYKDLMKKIEEGLHRYHATLASLSDNSPLTVGSAQQGRGSSAESPRERAFAKVNSVVPDSPAATAGLQTGDMVLCFGSVNWLNHDKLSKVAEEVSSNEGSPINVKVERENASRSTQNLVTLSLIPNRNWGGRGLLGCHLLPV